MVKRDPCWRAKKAVKQEKNHLDFSFRFKDVFVSCKNVIYEKCLGLVSFSKNIIRHIQYSQNTCDKGDYKAVFKLIFSSVCLLARGGPLEK